VKRRAPAAETYWVLEPAQLRCLVSARRHDIVDQLAARGPMAVREIAAAIHARPSALYYHLRQLLRAGLVVEAGSRVVRRKRESLYASPAPRMRFLRALQDPRNASMFVRIAAAMTRQMQRDFHGGIRSPAAVNAGARRNLGLFRLVGSPDARTLGRINQRLDEIAELFWSSAGKRGDVIALAWVLSPVGGRAHRSGSGTGTARKGPRRRASTSHRERVHGRTR
jgi:DNA-binding transcriptional ArsR family regulator